MRTIPLLVGALALASTAAAQTLTGVPAIFANAEGGTSGNIWRAGINRVQCFYDSTNFLTQGVVAPIRITNVEFRLAGGLTGAVVNYPNVSIYLQNAAVDFLTPSTTFATNRTVNPLPTANFTGSVTTTLATGTTPNDWFISIPLATPFDYDPSIGVDLLMEIEIAAAPVPVTGSTISTGFTAATHFCNSIRSVGSTAATAGQASAFCPVARFTHSPVPGAAVAQTTGAGCINRYSSFYELFATPAAFDLNNQAITLLPNGSGYLVIQSGSFIPRGASATLLSLTDDSEVNYAFVNGGSFPGFPSLTICSNGFVAAGPGNTTTGTTIIAAPSPITLLGAANTGFYCQADFDPASPNNAASAGVYVEESATVTTITWDGVCNWADPTVATHTFAPNTFQFQLYASGQVTIAWQSMGAASNNGGLMVGYSPGGPSIDPGSTDLSATTSLLLDGGDTPALALGFSNRPVVNTTWNLTTSNVPANTLVGVDIFGTADPGINDLTFLGAPGCGLRASLDVLNAWFPSGATHAYSLPIPNNPALIGVQLFTQSAAFQVPAANAFGAITSNGVAGLLGSI
ncbi:MAG: hypothetical protein ACK5AL_10045 [Planctomycetota bacterium]|jgi:hypothetical protein